MLAEYGWNGGNNSWVSPILVRKETNSKTAPCSDVLDGANVWDIAKVTGFVCVRAWLFALNCGLGHLFEVVANILDFLHMMINVAFVALAVKPVRAELLL